MTIENRFEEKTVVYKDLLLSTSKIHNWNSVDSFPLGIVDTDTRIKMNNIIAVEHSFKGVLNDRRLFDKLFQTVYARIIQYFERLGIASFVFKSEHKSQIRNRIRSHKGLVDKSILEGAGIQAEVNITDDYTLFGALLKLTPANANTLLDLFMDNDTSFIISTRRKDIVNDEFIKFVVMNFMNHKGNSSMNYLKLVSSLCVNGDLIHRMGGDGGDKEVDFQIFTLGNNEDLVVSSLML